MNPVTFPWNDLFNMARSRSLRYGMAADEAIECAVDFVVHRYGWAFLSVVMCFSISASSFAQMKPSAELLISSWMNLDRELKRDIHSYRLAGQYNSILYLKVNGKAPEKREAKWTAMHDGVRFRYSNADSLGEDDLSYDSKQWNSLNKGDKYRANGVVLFRPSAIYDFPLTKQYLSYNYPFDLSNILEDPTKTHSEIPLADQYATVLKYLQVSGPEVVNGRSCYHLHLSASYASSRSNPYPFIPSDLWMAIDNGHFVPWQFQTIYKTTTGKIGTSTILSFLDGQWYKSAWFPTRFLDVVEFRSRKEEQGHVTFLPIFRGEGVLSVSDINVHFDNSEFRLNFPPDTLVSVQDGVKGRMARAYRTPKPLRMQVLPLIIGFFMLTMLVGRIIHMKKRKRDSNLSTDN